MELAPYDWIKGLVSGSDGARNRYHMVMDNHTAAYPQKFFQDNGSIVHVGQPVYAMNAV